jgi:hypothetical protein
MSGKLLNYLIQHRRGDDLPHDWRDTERLTDVTTYQVLRFTRIKDHWFLVECEVKHQP